MAPNTLVGLKYFGVFKCTEVFRNDKGEITHANAEYVHDGTDKK